MEEDYGYISTFPYYEEDEPSDSPGYQGDYREFRDACARLLTKHFKGESWKTMIKKEDLDMDLPTLCVLGQLFGGYSFGAEKIGIDVGDCHEYGFNMNYTDPRSDRWQILRDAWLEIL